MFSVYGRKLSSEDPVRTIATASMIGLVADAGLCAFDFRLTPSLNLATDLAYQGLLGGALSLFLWLRLLKLEKTSKVTTLTFIAPVITLAFGVALTGVVPDYLSIGGVILIFVGIYVANILGRQKAEPPPNVAEPVISAGQRAS
jgi:drug/metabolite transporter (DMT)-like permease